LIWERSLPLSQVWGTSGDRKTLAEADSSVKSDLETKVSSWLYI
jgi:hypothetical protein